MVAEMRQALCSLAGSRGYTAAAVAIFATGIGAATAMVSVVNGVLLRPLPYPDSDRLVRIIEQAGNQTTPTGLRLRYAGGLELTELDVIRVRTRTLSHIAAYEVAPSALMLDGQTVGAEGARVGPGLFDMLGVPPRLGHTALAHASAVDGVQVVLSHPLWLQHFGGRADVLGRVILIDGREHTVIGVMPQGFHFPPESPVAFWTSLVPPVTELRSYRLVIARIADARTPVEASAEVTSIVRQHRQRLDVPATMAATTLGSPPPPPPPPPAPPSASSEPRSRPAPDPPRLAAPPSPPAAPADFAVASVRDQLVGPVRRGVTVLSGAVVLLLLIACANVTNLLLARIASRSRELAVKSALGADRRRLATAVLTESVLLACAGAVVGWLIALGAIRLVRVLGMTVSRQDLGVVGGMPRAGDIQFDAQTMVASVVLAIAVGALTGLVSVWRDAARLDVEALRGEMASMPAGFDALRRHRLQGLLIVLQVALAWTLVAGAGLLVRSYANLSKTSAGYDVAQVLTFQLRFGGPRPSSPLLDPREVPRMLAEYDRVTERIGALPGVTAVGYSQALPMTRTLNVVGLRMTPDPPRRPGGAIPPAPPVFGARLPPDQPNVRAVSAGFVDALGMRLVAGRSLQETDDALAPKAMLINRTLAESGFLWDDPIGRQIYAVGRQPWTIVGIVEDVRRFGLDQEPDPQIFVDFRQAPELLFGGPPMNVVVRTTGAPATLAPAILKSIRQLDPGLMMDRVATTSQLLSAVLARSRVYASLLGTFAAVALTLAALGVYAVLAYAVGQRTRELGVRRALGATQGDLARLVLGQVLTLMLAGLGLGVLLAAAGTRALESLLFGVEPLDTATFVGAGLVFGVVAVAAVIVPLKRAITVDPMLTLRAQ